MAPMYLESTAYAPTLSPDVLASLPESVQSYIHFLETSLQQLQIRVQELEARLAKNSSNSGKPPSSNGLKRPPKSERTSSGKKPGGQEGRIGKNLAQVENPDYIEIHTLMTCQGCGSNLGNVGGVIVEARQVFDIPKPIVEVTEHRAKEKQCP
jgi:transposase